MSVLFRCGIFFLLSIWSAQLLAHEVTTHEILVSHAVRWSVLQENNGALLSEIGYPGWSSVSYTNSEGYLGTALDTAKFGGRYEDTNYDIRAFNHFFDPQYNPPMGRGMQVLVSGISSPDWAIEDKGDVMDTHYVLCGNLSGCDQAFSFKDGQTSYYQSLVASTPATRLAAASRTLQIIGHITHHVQDMAQPQHVRNDQHTHPIPLSNSNPQWADYEQWTQSKNQEINSMLELIASTPNNPLYYAPRFSTARQYWHTADSVESRYLGMAEFTANNFISYGTPFLSGVSANYIGNSPGFPLPNGNGKRFVRQLLPAASDINGRPIPAGYADYIIGAVYDGFTGKSTEARLSGRSVTDIFLPDEKRVPYYNYVEDINVFTDQYKILLPRAVAFSTGLINHFFRGRLSLTPSATSGQWSIGNTSQDVMDGTFLIFAEDSNGIRTQLVGGSSRDAIGPGGSLTYKITPPVTTKKLVAAFRGKIGTEGDADYSSSFFAVAGRVVNYTPPEQVVPCGQTVEAFGGSNGISIIQEMGNKAGLVTLLFEAYALPDALQITSYGSNTLLAATKGAVSKTNNLSFQHNPDASGTTKVNVKVTGNPNQETAWALRMSCPGEKIPSPAPRLVRFELSNVAPACQARWELLLNGKYVAYPGSAMLAVNADHKYTLKVTMISLNNCNPGTPSFVDDVGRHLMQTGASILLRVNAGGGGGNG